MKIKEKPKSSHMAEFPNSPEFQAYAKTVVAVLTDEELAHKAEESRKVTESLFQELARRDEEKQRKAAAIRAEQVQKLVDLLNIDIINGLAPDHVRKSCGDEDLSNREEGCARCTLLAAMDERWLSPAKILRLIIESSF